MGEFLRKWVSRRLLKMNSNDIAKVMSAMRQYGNGADGGAEAIAMFQQLLYESWRDRELPQMLARVKIDETKLLRNTGVVRCPEGYEGSSPKTLRSR